MSKSPNFNLAYFDYEHLPEKLQKISKPFHDLAHEITNRYNSSPSKDEDAGVLDECIMCLRKLLEAKDCAVRASL